MSSLVALSEALEKMKSGRQAGISNILSCRVDVALSLLLQRSARARRYLFVMEDRGQAGGGTERGTERDGLKKVMQLRATITSHTPLPLPFPSFKDVSSSSTSSTII